MSHPKSDSPCVVSHWQILSKKPDASAEFYSKLFDWRVSTANALGYRTFETGREEGAQGGVWAIAENEGKPMVQVFVSVSDVSLYVEKAKAMGAEVILPPQLLPDGDEMAILLDPEGLPFGVTRTA